MELNKVVAKFKDGTLIKGKTNNFFPNKKLFHLNIDGCRASEIATKKPELIEIDVEKLKAAFFVKDFKGNQDYKDLYDDNLLGSGKKAEVQFIDGEIIIGYVLNYSPDRHGFF